MAEENIFVGIKFGSHSTVTQIFDIAEGVRDLDRGPIMSSVCLRQYEPIEGDPKIVFVGNETANQFAQPFCVISDLALLLSEDKSIHEDLQSKYFLPFTFDEDLKDRKITATWKQRNGQIQQKTIKIDIILEEYFKKILFKAKQTNSNAHVHVIVGVPPYIKRQGKDRLQEILMAVGFFSCKVHDSLELLSVLLEVDQIQSKTNYTIVFDIGYHHSSIAIIDNLTGYIIHRKDETFGGSDIICSLMKQLLKKYSLNLEDLNPTQINKLRSSCHTALVHLSMLPSTIIELVDFLGEDKNLESCITCEELNIIVDELYKDFFIQLEYKNILKEKFHRSTVLLIGMCSSVLEQKIMNIYSSMSLEQNEILVRNKAIAVAAVANFSFCRHRKLIKINREKKELEDKYTQLEDKYTQLEDKYTQLEDKYIQLEEKYIHEHTQLEDKCKQLEDENIQLKFIREKKRKDKQPEIEEVCVVHDLEENLVQRFPKHRNMQFPYSLSSQREVTRDQTHRCCCYSYFCSFL